MSRGVVVVGAGGHAKVCIELLQASGEEVAYCIGSEGGPDNCLGVPVLDGDEQLRRLRGEGFDRAFVAIGSNGLRDRLGQMCSDLGYELVNAISPRATVSPSARLGRGVAVMAGAVINAEARIDDLAIINTGATVDHDCHVGRAAHVAPQTALAGNVVLGELVFLGVGSRVIPGIRIGARTTVGAGAVVVRDAAADLVIVGVPARQLAE